MINVASLRRRWVRCAALVIFILVSGAFPAAARVANAADICFGLNRTDCALIADAAKLDSLRKLSSFDLAYTLSAALDRGNPQQPEIALTVEGNGAVALDSDTFGKLTKGDIGTAASRLQLMATSAASLDAPQLSQAGSVEIRVIGGVLYVRNTKPTESEWRSIPLSESNTKRPGIGTILGALRLLTAFNRFQDGAERFVTAERVADFTIDGQTIAALKFNIDLPKLLSSTELFNLVKAGQTLSGQAVNEQQVRETITVLAALSQDLKLSITRYVGTTDRLFHGIAIDLSGTLNPAVIGPMAGGGGPGGNNLQAYHLEARLDVTLRNPGNVPAIAAPEGAKPLD